MISRDESAKILGINSTDVSILAHWCYHFPKPIYQGQKSLYQENELQKWHSKYDVKMELRKAMQIKSEKYRESRKVLNDTADYKPIEPLLKLHIDTLLKCYCAKWRQFRNKEIYADYLNAEKFQQSQQLFRRLEQ
jgi:hypothetical protein